MMLGRACICVRAQPAVCAGVDTQVQAEWSRVIGGARGKGEDGEERRGEGESVLHGAVNVHCIPAVVIV